jgi:MFS transporter, DHA1 family, multidrug resistance protein
LSLSTPDPRRPVLTVPELVAMVAGLMALNALAIDIMLPALPDIGATFDVPGNDRQLVVTSYVLGFGIAQLFYGPLADALGRRRIMLFSLVAFLGATVLAIAAPDYGWLLAARLLQGVAAAATRVVAMALVRDLVSGRRMAQIMSFAITVFMIVPILAPGVGQLILFVAEWRWIFGALLIGTGLLTVWMYLRWPETLTAENRAPFALKSAAGNYWLAAKNRITLGYMLASSLIFGALFAFIATSEQVMAELYGLGEWFAVGFGGIAVGLAISSILNARIVGRLGMRRVSHTALIAFIAINGGHALWSLMAGNPPFWAFYALFGLGMMLFGMIGANFSALVMEPAGRRAGVTAALYGSMTSIGGAVLGALIGQAYDDTVTPLLAGMAILGLMALGCVLATERGRLFEPGEDAAEASPAPGE